MTDRVTLTGLRARGRHGVFERERRDGQEFVVDVTLEIDLRVPAGTDRLTDTVDYGGLADRLAAILSGEPMNLIEAVAARLADECLRDPRVAAVDVTLHKPSAPIRQEFADVSVSMRRLRMEAS